MALTGRTDLGVGRTTHLDGTDGTVGFAGVAPAK